MNQRNGAKKLYKAHKMWFAAGVAAVGLFSAGALGGTQVSAAVQPVTQSEPAQSGTTDPATTPTTDTPSAKAVVSAQQALNTASSNVKADVTAYQTAKQQQQAAKDLHTAHDTGDGTYTSKTGATFKVTEQINQATDGAYKGAVANRDKAKTAIKTDTAAVAAAQKTLDETTQQALAKNAGAAQTSYDQIQTGYTDAKNGVTPTAAKLSNASYAQGYKQGTADKQAAAAAQKAADEKLANDAGKAQTALDQIQTGYNDGKLNKPANADASAAYKKGYDQGQHDFANMAGKAQKANDDIDAGYAAGRVNKPAAADASDAYTVGYKQGQQDFANVAGQAQKAVDDIDAGYAAGKANKPAAADASAAYKAGYQQGQEDFANVAGKAQSNFDQIQTGYTDAKNGVTPTAAKLSNAAYLKGYKQGTADRVAAAKSAAEAASHAGSANQTGKTAADLDAYAKGLSLGKISVSELPASLTNGKSLDYIQAITSGFNAGRVMWQAKTYKGNVADTPNKSTQASNDAAMKQALANQQLTYSKGKEITMAQEAAAAKAAKNATVKTEVGTPTAVNKEAYYDNTKGVQTKAEVGTPTAVNKEAYYDNTKGVQTKAEVGTPTAINKEAYYNNLPQTKAEVGNPTAINKEAYYNNLPQTKTEVGNPTAINKEAYYNNLPQTKTEVGNPTAINKEAYYNNLPQTKTEVGNPTAINKEAYYNNLPQFKAEVGNPTAINKEAYYNNLPQFKAEVGNPTAINKEAYYNNLPQAKAEVGPAVSVTKAELDQAGYDANGLAKTAPATESTKSETPSKTDTTPAPSRADLRKAGYYTAQTPAAKAAAETAATKTIAATMPKTGDDNNVALASAGALTALVALFGLAGERRKHSMN
ncbi:LPXTG cell wall anchor domain-containing protein [Lacticaseibacillus sp. GG6-2]